MLPLRSWIALCLGKLAVFVCERLGAWRGGWGGTTLPGRLARRVDPGLLRRLGQEYARIVLVTGTNGKTTTTALLTACLRGAGFTDIVTNAEGANMLSGLTTALLKARPLGRRKCPSDTEPPARVAVLEVDEGSLEALSRELPAVDLVVVTNLFRDQLDRYTELAVLTEHLDRALSHWPQARLVLNADDPLVAGLGLNRAGVAYYSVAAAKPATLPRMAADLAQEAEAGERVLCPRCQGPLQFRARSYSHLGEYYCPGCGFSRPHAGYTVSGLRPASGGSGTSFTFAEGAGTAVTFSTSLNGLHNVYNAAAALTAARELGAGSLSSFVPKLAAFGAPQGRAEEFLFPASGLEGTLILVKNPAGLSQALRTVAAPGAARPFDGLLLAINDLAADGRDVSWLWDVDYTPLADLSIICAGRRAADLAVCLKYHGLPRVALTVVPGLEKSVNLLLARSRRRFAILCTYTNLAPYRWALLKKGGVRKSAAHDRAPLPGTA